MKEKLPLDRRQFFRYLKLVATEPEAFRSEQMMRIDQLPDCDRHTVESLRPVWRPNVRVERTANQIRCGARAWAIEAGENAFLDRINGHRTIGEIVALADGSGKSYDRCVRLLTALAGAGAVDLNPPGDERVEAP